MDRSAVIINESSNRINKMKEEFKKLNTTENKIKSLEITNSVLKKAATAVGIITVIDLVVPDPVFGIDEAILTGATALLGSATVVIDNKIDNLKSGEDASITVDEAKDLTFKLLNVLGKSKSKNDLSDSKTNSL